MENTLDNRTNIPDCGSQLTNCKCKNNDQNASNSNVPSINLGVKLTTGIFSQKTKNHGYLSTSEKGLHFKSSVDKIDSVMGGMEAEDYLIEWKNIRSYNDHGFNENYLTFDIGPSNEKKIFNIQWGKDGKDEAIDLRYFLNSLPQEIRNEKCLACGGAFMNEVCSSCGINKKSYTRMSSTSNFAKGFVYFVLFGISIVIPILIFGELSSPLWLAVWIGLFVAGAWNIFRGITKATIGK